MLAESEPGPKGQLTSGDLAFNGPLSNTENRKLMAEDRAKQAERKRKKAETAIQAAHNKAKARAELVAEIPAASQIMLDCNGDISKLKNVRQIKALIVAVGGEAKGGGTRGEWEAKAKAAVQLRFPGQAQAIPASAPAPVLALENGDGTAS